MIDGITKWVHGWQKNGWINASKKPVRNADLWHELIAAAAPHKIAWEWVKGHDGHPENERADQLACAAARGAARTLSANRAGRVERRRRSRSVIASRGTSEQQLRAPAAPRPARSGCRSRPARRTRRSRRVRGSKP